MPPLSFTVQYIVLTIHLAIRTSYEEETARARPLDMARRCGGDMLELTDHSSDSTRRPRPSQPSATTGPQPSVLANKDDPIIITSGSEDDRFSGKRRRVAPPVDVEVISILDSEEEEVARGVGVARQTGSAAPVASASGVNRVAPPVRPSQRVPAVPPPLAKPAVPPLPPPAPIPGSSTSTQLPEPPPSRPQGARQQDAELPPRSPSLSYGPPPDDFDDVFNDLDFIATGDDAHPGALDGWDGLDVGPSLATLPVLISSGAANASVSGSVPEGSEDVSGPDALFDSYVDMDQLGGDTDQGTSEGALLGGSGDGVEGEVESGAANDVGEGEGVDPSTSGSGNHANVDGDGDLRSPSFEEGEVDPNDPAPVRSARTPDTPESGEIRSQELRSGGEVRMAKGDSPSSGSGSVAPSHVSSSSSSKLVLAKLAPTSTFAHLASAVSTWLSPSSESPRLTASQPLGRARTLLMPDILSYKGVRFKRPPPDQRENPFFSRALNNSTGRSAKAPVSMGEGSASGGAPTAVPVEVGEVQNRDVDTDMQDADAATSIPEVVVPTPTSLPQPPAEAPPMAPDTQSTSSTAQARPSTVEPNTTATDGPPASVFASTQPTPQSSQVTLSQPPPATQPLARSSSRPFIAPSRVPRTSTPMSLVDALNEVRRERLEALEEQRELARSRNAVDPMGASVSVVRSIVSHAVPHPAGEDPTASTSAPPKSADQGPVQTLPPSLPSTPTPSSRSQSTKALGRTPSLNDIRALLARRNVSGSQPGRLAHGPTSTPTQTSQEGGDARVPVVTVAVPVPRSMDGADRVVSSLERASTQSGAWSTPTPATTKTTASGLGASSLNGASATRREVSFVPFKAFISPVQSRGRDVKHDHGKGKSVDKGKGKEVVHATDASFTPTAARPRTDGSASLFSSQRPKARESRHGRRESAAFEAYIVRDSPKQTSVARTVSTSTDPRTGTDDVQLRPGIQPLVHLPREPRLSDSGSPSVSVASSVASPVMSDTVPDMAQVPVLDVGGHAPLADDTNGMDVDAGDGCVDATRMDDGMGVGEGEPETTNEGEADEADSLLELASVHLTPVEAEVITVNETNKVGGMDVVDEVRGACTLFFFSLSDLALLRGPTFFG